MSIGLRPISKKMDSFRVTDTSYTRQNIKIDHEGIKSQDEEKSETPKHASFIKDISEIIILDALGNGASGYVSQALHIPTQRMVAIKKISVYEKNRRHQIMNEFNALDSTDCSGLVEFYGLFFSKGSVLIALEYCECGSLADILQKVDCIPEEVLAKISESILDGLDMLHTQKKQVHRDLKPSNICLNKLGVAKVTDFGISRELKDSFGNCRSYIGTYTYMSPERIRSEPYSFQSDIWGFGLTLMECAIGKFPYESLCKTDVYLDMIQYIATEKPPSLESVAKEMKFSTEFQEFLCQCIHPDPAQRPTAKELKQHSWIRKSHDSGFDMERWIKSNHLIIKTPSEEAISSRISAAKRDSVLK